MAENRNELAFYLNQARLRADQDRFDEAREAIVNAYKFASSTEVPLVDDTSRQIEEQRIRRAREIGHSLEDLLALAPEQVTDEQLRQGEELLARLRSLPADPDEADRFQERWREHRHRVTTRRVLQETKAELERLWGYHYLYVSYYDEAVALARKRAGEYPAEPVFQELARQAEQKREAAYKASGELSTQATTASFQGLIKQFQNLYDKGATELPWYEWGRVERDGQQVRTLVFQRLVPASQEPITHLVALAREYEDGKAEEYRQKAQDALPADPELAAEQVLPVLLPDTPVPKWVVERLSADELRTRRERFTYCSEQKRREITAFYKDTIVPALTRRERARKLLAKAQEIGQDPETAWGLVAEAAAVDPYLTEPIADAREVLRPQLRVRWSQELQKAEETRRDGDFEDALAVAERIRAKAEGDDGLCGVFELAGRLRTACVEDRELWEYVRGEVQRLIGLVEQQPTQAAQALADLEARVFGRPLRFQQLLQALRQAVQARQSLDQKIAGWERRLRQTDPTLLDDQFFRDQRRLEALLQELKGLQEEVEGEQAEARLTPLRQRITARDHCLRGRAAWFVGLYEQARAHWLKARGGDDDVLITRWLQEAENATLVLTVLSQAENLRAAGRYPEALRILEPWLPPKASPRQTDVIRQRDAIAQEYVEKLIGQIEDLVRDTRPLYMQFVELVRELENVAPHRAAEYKIARFPAVYEEWGDQKYQQSRYREALQNYDEALKYARGNAHVRIAGKRRRTRKQIAFNQIQTLRLNQQWSEMRRELEDLLKEYPEDVETLCRLADIVLEQEDAAQAKRYLDSAHRRLDEAEIRSAPAIAGLDFADEIVEWRLRLRGQEVWAEATEEIARFMEKAGERLQPSSAIGEYRLARQSCDTLVERLRQWEAELAQEAGSHSQQFTQRATVRSQWNRVRRWLRDQAQDKVKARYSRLEGDLMRRLEQDLEPIAIPDVETLEFREAAPKSDLRQRWTIGLKVLYLSSGHRGETVHQEILRALSRLRVVVQDLQGDSNGPTEDLQRQAIEPKAALEHQILWAENVQAWTALVRDLLDDYAFAAGQEEGRNEGRQAHDNIEAFKIALVQLQRAAQTVEARLAAAVMAGKEGRHHWGQVNWRQVVKQILPDDDRRDLEDTDRDRRWMGWQHAAKFFQLQHLSEQPERARWERINTPITDAGIEEGWERVLEPLSDMRRQFGQHRLVGHLTRSKDEAEVLRNRLVLSMAELYVLVQAEEFQAALTAMNGMETLDGGDAYGFRARMAMDVPQGGPPLGWQALRQRLEAQQRQWEEWRAWWAEVEHSALRRWREVERAEVVALIRRAEYGTAEDRCKDARDGVLPGGRTNRLGGGLALKPLLNYLHQLPVALQTPLSRRVEQAMRALPQWEHDTAEAVRELDIWLTPALE